MRGRARCSPPSSPRSRPRAIRSARTTACASRSIPEQPLQIGMTAEVNIVVRETKDALLVPFSALRGEAVFVVEGARVRRRAIRAGIVGTSKVEVLEGIKESDLVVSDPPAGLKDGDFVKVRAAPAAAGTARRPRPSRARLEPQARHRAHAPQVEEAPDARLGARRRDGRRLLHRDRLADAGLPGRHRAAGDRQLAAHRDEGRVPRSAAPAGRDRLRRRRHRAARRQAQDRDPRHPPRRPGDAGAHHVAGTYRLAGAVGPGLPALRQQGALGHDHRHRARPRAARHAHRQGHRHRLARRRSRRRATASSSGAGSRGAWRSR